MYISGVKVDGENKKGIEVMSVGTNSFSFITIEDLLNLYDSKLIDLECIIDGFKVQRDLLETGKSGNKFDVDSLIKAIINGETIGVTHLSLYKGQWKLVDGEQRYTNLIYYLKNMFPIKCKNTKIDGNKLDSVYFNDLSVTTQNKIKSMTLPIVILNLNSLEEFSTEFMTLNSGKPVNATEIYKALLGEKAPRFEILLEKTYMKKVIYTISNNRENKFDMILKLAYIVYWNNCNIAKTIKTDKELKKGESYATQKPKIKQFINELKQRDFLVEEVITEINTILDYMALAFDNKSYYEDTPKLKIRGKDSAYNFLGKSKVHSMALFACVHTAIENEVNPKDFLEFAKYIHVSLGKDILERVKSKPSEYIEYKSVYEYWNQADNNSTDGKIHKFLKEAFVGYLKKNNLYLEDKECVKVS